MIQSLFELQRFLPTAITRPILRGFWKKYWEEESRLAAQAAGLPPVDLDRSERPLLIEAIAGFYPFSSVLEVGCAFGQNFHTLAALFPNVKMLGIDRDSLKIREGRELLKQAQLPNVELRQFDALALPQLGTKSFDVVYSSASLLEIPPDKIQAVLSGMLGAAKKAVILLEQHLEAEDETGVLGLPQQRQNGTRYWVRDYVQLLSQFVPTNRILVRKIPNSLWFGERWEDCGRVFIVRPK